MLFLTLALFAQETYRLEVQAEKGDLYRLTRIDKFEGKAKLLDEKQSVQEDSILSREESVSRNTVLEADKGAAGKVERKFEKSIYEAKVFGSKETEKGKRDLDGKTVTMTRSGEETKFAGAEDIAQDELVRIQFRRDPFVESLPKDAIGTGQKWNVDESALKEFYVPGGGV